MRIVEITASKKITIQPEQYCPEVYFVAMVGEIETTDEKIMELSHNLLRDCNVVIKNRIKKEHPNHE